MHHQASCFILHHVEHALLLSRVVSESENPFADQVSAEVNPSVEVGFDICGTDPEPEYIVNQGKPRMHLNLSLCFEKLYITFVNVMLH